MHISSCSLEYFASIVQVDDFITCKMFPIKAEQLLLLIVRDFTRDSNDRLVHCDKFSHM